MVNESSVFEPLKFYYIIAVAGNVAMPGVRLLALVLHFSTDFDQIEDSQC